MRTFARRARPPAAILFSESMQSIPLSLPLARTAFFFDFDGTLVDLAPTPDAIQVPPDRKSVV